MTVFEEILGDIKFYEHLHKVGLFYSCADSQKLLNIIKAMITVDPKPKPWFLTQSVLSSAIVVHYKQTTLSPDRYKSQFQNHILWLYGFGHVISVHSFVKVVRKITS